jgi:hypothetical protein
VRVVVGVLTRRVDGGQVPRRVDGGQVRKLDDYVAPAFTRP